MTSSLQNSEEILLTPPQNNDLKNKKLWLIGMWLSPRPEADNSTENFKSLTYHWDNRPKLESDIKAIKAHINGLKILLYPALNAIHQSNHSARYWDVLLSEWIYIYTQVTFDRWSVVELAFKSIDNPKFINQSYQKNGIPFDTNCYQKSAASNHSWNANLLTDVSTDFFGSTSFNITRNRKINQTERTNPGRTNLKRKFLHVLQKLYVALIPERRGIFVQSLYLGQAHSIQVCLKLKALMFLDSIETYLPRREVGSLTMREALSNSLIPQNSDEPFLKFYLKSVADYFPAIYLEEYVDHTKFAEEKYFHYFPKLIVTANSHYSDESWKNWAATAAEKGTKIIVLQHGGHYGHSKFSLIQDYEIEMSNKFLSWGWTVESNNKVQRSPASKLVGLGKTGRSKETCLVVTFENSSYSIWLASFPIGPQVLNSYQMTIEFLRGIKQPLIKSVRVRTYPTNFWLNQRETIETLFPEVTFSPRECNFLTDLQDARVVVFNYFSTTFIEAVKLGIPSVVFINPLHWEVADEYITIFSALANVGVLHHSSKSCAEFVAEHWDEVEKWWSNPRTSQVIDEFIGNFGYTGNNPITEFSKAILGNLESI